jgi:hypothetical protein
MRFLTALPSLSRATQSNSRLLCDSSAHTALSTATHNQNQHPHATRTGRKRAPEGRLNLVTKCQKDRFSTKNASQGCLFPVDTICSPNWTIKDKRSTDCSLTEYFLLLYSTTPFLLSIISKLL